MPKVLMLGGSGFVGAGLGIALAEKGFEIRVLSTRGPKVTPCLPFPCQVRKWTGQSIDPAHLDGIDLVVNLAGEAVFTQRWTKKAQERMRRSRLDSTKALVHAIESRSSQNKPKLVIQASAIGYYGEGAGSCFSEKDQPGDDFLARLSSEWEAAAAPLASHCRLVIMRFGLILGWTGGILPQLWNLYAVGLGAQLGAGKQWMNWVHQEDVHRLVLKAIDDESYSGVYNVVAPEAITSQHWHQQLSQYTSSPTWMRLPGPALHLALGERAGALLASPRVVSQRLEQQGFSFLYSKWNAVLEALLEERQLLHCRYLKVQQWLPRPLEELWPFMSKPENLEAITPDWLQFHIEKVSSPEMAEGTVIDYKLRLKGLPVRWRSEITEWLPPNGFTDVQLKGPYQTWQHRHRFRPFCGGTLVEDLVEYQLPILPLSLPTLPLIESDLERIFNYRREALAAACAGAKGIGAC